VFRAVKQAANGSVQALQFQEGIVFADRDGAPHILVRKRVHRSQQKLRLTLAAHQTTASSANRARLRVDFGAAISV
jgi:hypothetical protein